MAFFIAEVSLILTMSYHFYIIFSDTKNQYYVRHSAELTGRLHKHNSNHKGYTGTNSDWKIVYSEEFTSKTRAYSRE